MREHGHAQMKKRVCGNCKLKKGRPKRRCYKDTKRRKKVGIKDEGRESFKNRWDVN